MSWATCGASRPIAVTWAGEATRPLVPLKHFPPAAGGTGGIHCERMKHDRRVTISVCCKAAIKLCRDGCGDEGRSAAENFNGALVALINSAERRNFAGGMERWMGRAERWRSRSRGCLGASQSCGLRVCPLAESLARGRVNFTRRASTQAKSRTSQRGVEPVKFGRDSAFFYAAGTDGSKSKNANDCKNDVTTGNQAERLEGVNGQAGSE